MKNFRKLNLQSTKYLKQKYCEDNRIVALIFDNKKDAREFTVYGVKKIPDTPRALYILDRNKKDEKLMRTNIIANKLVETKIKLIDSD